MTLRILNERQAVDNLIMEFGRGELVIELGTLAGVPAVFIAVAGVPQPDLMGALASTDEKGDRTILSPGEVVLLFPTKEQAQKVRDALLCRFKSKISPEAAE
jgi:hypothetical protein